MDDIKAVRDALAAKIATVDFDFAQVSSYVLPNPYPPCAYIGAGEQDWPDGNAVRDEKFVFIVNVLISKASDVLAQQRQDTLIASTGPTSIRAAIEDTEGENTVTLGGLVADVQVTRCRPDRLFPINNPLQPHEKALGAEWTVWVWPKPA